MSDQYAPTAAGLAILPAKRRRGRPRKDGGVPKRGTCLSPPPPAPAPKAPQLPLETNRSDPALQNMIGKPVSGVIDGCFEAGYFLTIRVEDSDTLLRGLVFRPGRFTPVSASNDVAPQAKMYHRKDIPVPGPTTTNNPPEVQNETDQPPPPPVAVTVPQPGPLSFEMTETPFPPPNITTVQQGHDQRFQIQTQTDQRPEVLRTVEHDDVMQVFELSPPSQSQQLPENDGEEDTLLPDQSTGRSDSGLTRNPTGDPGSQIESNHGQEVPKSDSGQFEAPPEVEEPQPTELMKQGDVKGTAQKPEEFIDSGIGQNGVPELMNDHSDGGGRMDTHGLFGNPVVGGSTEFGFGIGDLVHPPASGGSHGGNPNNVGSPPATLND